MEPQKTSLNKIVLLKPKTKKPDKLQLILLPPKTRENITNEDVKYFFKTMLNILAEDD